MGDGVACTAEEMMMLVSAEKEGVATDAQLHATGKSLMALLTKMEALRREEMVLLRWLIVLLFAWLTFLKFLP